MEGGPASRSTRMQAVSTGSSPLPPASPPTAGCGCSELHQEEEGQLQAQEEAQEQVYKRFGEGERTEKQQLTSG
ncbi:hypothetical protein F7725_001053 [Dissostichus mawsoni]|uniref:Uncharacterized protein n=1 Tax=Dissostichus mawsoni TaxID=36200 RepID=A0A7J5ZKA9_DISMA|nr:hypothetical protein F7725_001053 [Dissostichus mawsoni]